MYSLTIKAVPNPYSYVVHFASNVSILDAHKSWSLDHTESAETGHVPVTTESAETGHVPVTGHAVPA